MTNVSADIVRARFSAALSAMYKAEVPAYGTLVEMVAEINRDRLTSDPSLKASLAATDGVDRLTEERHGAIRLGTAAELSMMRRAFAVMGMVPVGYYDLTVAGLPVHSTTFRPVTAAALAANPFRVFTSLLRLDLISDADLRRAAEEALGARQIFTADAIRLIEKAESEDGLAEPDASRFIAEVLETFRWHDKATVSLELYQRLHKAHRLVADVVSFRGPHINHLTPRTLDIDAVQAEMPKRGIVPKEVIEGPPCRAVPILLRQTSFKALEESVSFANATGAWIGGTHTARFGEIEQRGAALTPKGRALYDASLARAQRGEAEAFADFPDDLAVMRAQGLAYVEYTLTNAGERAAAEGGMPADMEHLVDAGFVAIHPIVYEDFLPVSAAGIFRSNLGSDPGSAIAASPNKPAFEAALGAHVRDEFALYAEIEKQSATRVLHRLSRRRIA